MNPTALAILGLFFWSWSHQFQHLNERAPNTLHRIESAITACIGSALLICALITAVE